MIEVTKVKDESTLTSFLFSEMLKIGEINNKLDISKVKLKVVKIILPRTIDTNYVDATNIKLIIKEAGILIEFSGDEGEVLYQLNSTEIVPAVCL